MRQGTTTTGVDGYELSLSSAGKVFVRFNQQSNSDVLRLNSNTNYPLSGSVWMHVAATYDGTNIKLYINGALDNTGQNQTFTIAANTLPLVIGRQNDASFYTYYKGKLDDVQIYNRALTLSEIQELAAISPVIPNAPSNLVVIPISSSALQLSWTDNSSDETGFEVERSTTGSTGPFTLLTSVASNVVTYNNTGLSPSAEYCYRVRAIGSGGNSNYTTPVCATTLAASSINAKLDYFCFDI